MERYQKKTKIDTIRSRKNEVRRLLKSCFGNVLFSLVPFEIWRDLIVSNADLKSIVSISRTCYAFKEIVDNIGENNFNLALMLRREGQIILAKKYLLLLANNNNSFAMFYLGYACASCGWGLKLDEEKGAEWFKKSAELGNVHAMTYYAKCLRHGFGVGVDEELSNIWGKKALSSNNSFAVGFCRREGLVIEEDNEEAFLCFEASAKEGDEFGQYYLGDCFRYGYGTEDNDEKALYWLLKSAEGGNYEAQDRVGDMYRYGLGCRMDGQKAVTWYKKAAKQGNQDSIRAMKEIRIEMD